MDWLSPVGAITLLIFSAVVAIAGYFAKQYWKGWATREIARDDRLDNHGEEIGKIKEKQAVHAEKHKHHDQKDREHDKSIEKLNDRLDRFKRG